MSDLNKLYSVEWSHGMKKSNLPKSEAIRIINEMIDTYDEITIKVYDKWRM